MFDTGEIYLKTRDLKLKIVIDYSNMYHVKIQAITKLIKVSSKFILLKFSLK